MIATDSMIATVVSPGEPNPTDRTAVVLVNYNGTGDTLKCLESLHEQAAGRCRIVVVDNGSDPDASNAFARSFPRVSVLRREQNGGWAGGNNTGISYALDRGADRVILLNNDTVVAPTFLERLQAAATVDRFGIIGPVICFMAEPSKVMTDGCRFNRPDEPGLFHRQPIPLGSADTPEILEVDIVNGCCMMIEAEVFRRIGLIDERFFLIHEESDFCLRARRHGFRCGVFGEPLVLHKGSSAFRRSGLGLQRYYDTRNLFLLLKKHQGGGLEGRGRLGSWATYFRYVYHRYCLEREQGEAQAAEAIARGLHDALTGRYGALDGGRPWATLWLVGLLELARRSRLHLPRCSERPE